MLEDASAVDIAAKWVYVSWLWTAKGNVERQLVNLVLQSISKHTMSGGHANAIPWPAKAVAPLDTRR